LGGLPIVVTGVGGFLGSRLVERLLKEGASVLGLDLTEGKLGGIDKNNEFAFTICDLGEIDQTSDVITSFSPRILYHFACHPDGPEDFKQIRSSIYRNLLLTTNVLEAFSKCEQPELFIYGDSCKVYGDSEVPYHHSMPAIPLSSYAIGKSAGWHYCELYDRIYSLKSVSVRPILIYGPFQAFNLITYVVESVLNQKKSIQLDGGDQTRDPLYVEDAISAYVAVAKKREKVAGHIINIGGGYEITVHKLAELIVDMMGSDTPVVSNMARKRPTETKRNYCDNEEAKRILGWQPWTDLRTGLNKTIQYLMRIHEQKKVVS
jgi:UDP-glucose 4-epimerase